MERKEKSWNLKTFNNQKDDKNKGTRTNKKGKKSHS